MTSYRVLGVNDEFTTCECCGKTNLKCTVALEALDSDSNGTGEIKRFGRDCAAQAVMGKRTSGNAKTVELTGRGIAYAQKWLGKTGQHTAAVVASAVRVKFCPCWESGEFSITFASGVVVDFHK